MARSTPEGKVKKAIDGVLAKYPDVWYAKPVVGGLGSPLLDYIGCRRGAFFAIEAKAPGNKPTPRQWFIIESMRMSGAKVFLIEAVNDPALLDLDAWLAGTEETEETPR